MSGDPPSQQTEPQQSSTGDAPDEGLFAKPVVCQPLPGQQHCRHGDPQEENSWVAQHPHKSRPERRMRVKPSLHQSDPLGFSRNRNTSQVLDTQPQHQNEADQFHGGPKEPGAEEGVESCESSRAINGLHDHRPHPHEQRPTETTMAPLREDRGIDWPSRNARQETRDPTQKGSRHHGPRITHAMRLRPEASGSRRVVVVIVIDLDLSLHPARDERSDESIEQIGDANERRDDRQEFLPQ